MPACSLSRMDCVARQAPLSTEFLIKFTEVGILLLYPSHFYDLEFEILLLISSS